MPIHPKTNEELIIELHELQQKYDSLKRSTKTDIRKQKLTEEALQEADWKFRALFEKGPIGVAYHVMVNDALGKPIDYLFLDANEAYIELTGVDPRGKLATEAFPGIENDPFDWIGTFGKVARTGETIRFEQYLQPNQRWYDCVAYQYKPNHFVATFFEITQRKKALKALKESEVKYRKMVENMNSGISIYQAINNGEDFKFIDFNKAAEKITNTSANNVVGKTLLSQFPNMDKSPLFMALQNVYKSGENLHLPPFFYKDKQREGWRENYIYKLPSGEIVAIFDDVTKRKNAEIDLKNQNYELNLAKERAEKSESKFRTFFDRVADAIFIYNPNNFEIIEANEATSKTYGYNMHELIGMSCLKFSAEVEESIKNGEKIKKEGEGPVNIRHHRTKDGADIFVQLNGYKIIVNKQEMIFTVCHDITNVKITEKELIEAKERAEESDRIKTAFLQNMSHEIRTPMNSIMGFASLLPDEEDKESINNFSAIIYKNAEQLVHIIDDIVLYSQLQNRQLTFIPKVFDALILFNDLINSFNLPEYQKGVELVISTFSNKPILLFSDYDKIQQIFTNLISNAFKYTCKGSITIGITKNETEFVLFVKDTGMGIPKLETDKIFSRFYRASNINKSAIGGTGLGLSIVQELVELLGGKIWIESEEGLGSTFYFSLPFKSNLITA
jgi:PAS domain S-box-containing protein